MGDTSTLNFGQGIHEQAVVQVTPTCQITQHVPSYTEGGDSLSKTGHFKGGLAALARYPAAESITQRPSFTWVAGDYVTPQPLQDTKRLSVSGRAWEEEICMRQPRQPPAHLGN